MPTDPLLKLVGAPTPELIMLPMNWVAAAAWSLQTVYDLSAKISPQNVRVHELPAIDTGNCLLAY
jgi:hypothetical protein